MTRPLLYVDRITNLSDARYCAGMGVDLLGAMVDTVSDEYVSPKAWHDMMGWVAGPKQVAHTLATDISASEIIQSYKPDFIHCPAEAILKNTVSADVEIIAEISFLDWQQKQELLKLYKGQIRYLVLTQLPSENEAVRFLSKVASDIPLLLELNDTFTGDVKSFFEKTGVAGFVLQGERELQPGLKEYNHLSRVLEQFD
ncbi:MAG: hypothetical protein K2U26_08935 [Cyclobacteriaceae bacterium]|nr:hypothetical protein [Cyclobacteriaceae bacterium]